MIQTAQMDTIREMRVAFAYLKAFPTLHYINKQLGWPCVLLEMSIAERLGRLAESCAPWFEPVKPGPYAVHSVGEAGVVRVEFAGFHYPYQALAKAEELEAAKGNRREHFFAVNEDDAESSVEAEDDDYCERVVIGFGGTETANEDGFGRSLV